MPLVPELRPPGVDTKTVIGTPSDVIDIPRRSRGSMRSVAVWRTRVNIHDRAKHPERVFLRTLE